MDRSAELGLAGVEIPLTAQVPSFEGRIVDLPASNENLGDALRDRRLQLVADYGVLVENDVEHIVAYLRLAKLCGARGVRAILSNVLCGDRATVPEGWQARLQAVADRLREILPVAEELGLWIAIENHQDATSDDLLRLHEMSGFSPAYGITLDTGNPLAVCEDPIDSCRRLADLIRHVHLKDYTIHFAPEGYRLARCVAGEGVIDFPKILEIMNSTGHDVSYAIEIAAQSTRTIPFLRSQWWKTFPDRLAADLTQALQLLWLRGKRPDEPYASLWEQGVDSVTVCADEWSTVCRSVDYFARILSERAG
jgi:sugar phosphate isomerase/epimerase